MRYKTFCLTTIISGLLLTLGSMVAISIVYTPKDFMDTWPFCSLTLGIALMITALVNINFRKSIKKYCTVKTSILAVCISAMGALGIKSAFSLMVMASFGERHQHPVRYPFYMSTVFFALAAFVFLIVFYFVSRKDKMKIKGIIFDVMTSILYLPFFLCSIMYADSIL